MRGRGLLDEAGDVEGGEGRLLRGLEDDGAAGGEGRAQLPGEHHEREVPRDDLRPRGHSNIFDARSARVFGCGAVGVRGVLRLALERTLHWDVEEGRRVAASRRRGSRRAVSMRSAGRGCLSDDSNGLVERVAERVAFDGQHLAFDLVGPARVVAEALDGQMQVCLAAVAWKRIRKNLQSNYVRVARKEKMFE